MKLLNEYDIYFHEDGLINTALTHTTYANEHNCESYERLEFLGDAVLEVICSDYIFKKLDLKEGEMSRLRSLYVCENALYEYSKQIDLKSYIRVGNGIKEANKTIIADVFEAVMGVIYLEKGYMTAKRLFDKLIVPYIENNVDFLSDYKSLLQELVQTDKQSLEYEVIKEFGPAHKKSFEVVVKIDDIIYGKGFGRSKKEAEQNAAKNAYEKRAK